MNVERSLNTIDKSEMQAMYFLISTTDFYTLLSTFFQSL